MQRYSRIQLVYGILVWCSDEQRARRNVEFQRSSLRSTLDASNYWSIERTSILDHVEEDHVNGPRGESSINHWSLISPHADQQIDLQYGIYIHQEIAD